jgi:DNA-directed RNA polymerase alpha subunit
MKKITNKEEIIRLANSNIEYLSNIDASRSDYASSLLEHIYENTMEIINLLEPEPITLDKTNLSERAYNCLKSEGITTMDQLRDASKRALMSIPGLGISCMDEVDKLLEEQL